MTEPAETSPVPKGVPAPAPPEAEFSRLDGPEIHIIRRTAILATPLVGIYALCAFGIGRHPDDYRYLFAWIHDEHYRQFTRQMEVSNAKAACRICWIVYASLFVAMWWVYFRSKIGPGPNPEMGGLKVRTLRRSLGLMSAQWGADSEDDIAATTEAYQRKSESSMVVFSMLIAGSILLFEQLANLWCSDAAGRTTWEIIVIWLGMLASTVSFVCLMLCVDSLDTIFNVFPDSLKHKSIRYFYRYTIDPRYAAVASMLGAMILLLAIYDETLASMLIGVTYWIGYSFWFPDFSEPPQKLKRRSGIALVLLPFVVLMATAIL